MSAPANWPLQPGPELLSEYADFRNSLTYCRLPRRTAIELAGPDRAKFLHNLCTNDILRLRQNTGCEAFITNVQGKILGHVQIFCRENSLWLETVPDQSQSLIEHLDRYRIREKVEFFDRTTESETIVCVSEPSQRQIADLANVTLPASSYESVESQIDGGAAQIRTVRIGGEKWSFVAIPSNEVAPVVQKLAQQGFREVQSAAWEMCRIESGWPQFGSDISNENLPHEVNRVRDTISFTKGCYLGQETVARIDALGHVNWLLMGVQFVPSSKLNILSEKVPAELTLDGKPIVRIRSRTWSPRFNAAIALAYVRREHAALGNRLKCAEADVEVIQLAESTDDKSIQSG